ncbi:MAG: carboxypeptidase-like regulatory domain-containing protein, partial [Muribaculaceae bacterium]|nr:carboxypeptidase-like regulatory domain-containing protein [Muribaculaceae bacterium]
MLVLSLSAFTALGQQARTAVVADSTTRFPLPNASVFDRHGRAVGVSGRNGRLPVIAPESYPLTVRYLGFMERVVPASSADTVFMQENVAELPEMVVERRARMLHVLAYVREYSTLTTYSDTVSLFREKMVDYMLPPDDRAKFRGWKRPRVIASKSFYRFSNSLGLDSVSSKSNHHFSWSDWIGLAPSASLPQGVRGVEAGTDTVSGRYAPREIWMRSGDRLIVDVDVLADTLSRKWVPNLTAFFNKGVDFDRFNVRFNYDYVDADTVALHDVSGFTFNIESNGRGHDMFMFNKVYEPLFVSTYGEVYILDKEYITVKEARQWEKRRFDKEEVAILVPQEAPELQPAVLALVERVNAVDNDKVRT